MWVMLPTSVSGNPFGWEVFWKEKSDGLGAISNTMLPKNSPLQCVCVSTVALCSESHF